MENQPSADFAASESTPTNGEGRVLTIDESFRLIQDLLGVKAAPTGDTPGEWAGGLLRWAEERTSANEFGGRGFDVAFGGSVADLVVRSLVCFDDLTSEQRDGVSIIVTALGEDLRELRRNVRNMGGKLTFRPRPALLDDPTCIDLLKKGLRLLSGGMTGPGAAESELPTRPLSKGRVGTPPDQMQAPLNEPMNGFQTPRVLAEYYHIPKPQFEAFRKALERFRQSNDDLMNAAFEQIEDRRVNQEKWRYSADHVKTIIEEYRQRT